MRVFFSVGHDAERTGAYNEKYDIREYDVCVELTQYCIEEAIELGISSEKVYADRLGSAIKEVNQKASSDDLAIECHFNSFPDASVKGCETICYTGNVKGRELAQDIQNSLLAHLGVKDRGILERDDLAFLEKTKCTSIVTEPFFLSNEEEVKRFLLKDREANLRNLAYCIARGVKDYLNKYK